MPQVHTISPEDLLRMPDDRLYELVDGELREKNLMGARACLTASQLIAALVNYNRAHPSGLIFTELTYQCFPHKPSQVRRPDISFIRFGRLPGEVLPEGHIKIAPDLAVEVVSPNDEIDDLETKLEDYRKAQIPQVWIVYPNPECVRIHRLNGTITELRKGQELMGENILPGFSFAVADLFNGPGGSTSSKQ